MTQLDYSAFSTSELEQKLRSLAQLLDGGTLSDRSALNQRHEIAALQAELKRRGGSDGNQHDDAPE